MPYLERIHEFSKKSSPTLSMLKFINLILKPLENDINGYYNHPVSKAQIQLNNFLLSFMLTFVKWVPHNLNEEAFKVLDTLLSILRFSLKYEHIKEVTLALLDKYTMRSKIHKETMNSFINLLLEHDNFSEIGDMSEHSNNYTGFFVQAIISEPNCIENFTKNSHNEKVDFIEKVNLLNMLINDMDEQHSVLFDAMVRNVQLQNFLCLMIKSEVTSI